MTFRERLADWISGGEITLLADAAWRKAEEASKWREAYGEVELGWGKTQHDLEAARQGLRQAVGVLAHIRDATANGKSGTAQKIHRMAKEALGDE